MRTTTVSEVRALHLQAMLNTISSGNAKVPPAFNSIKVAGSNMLVDPLNGAPFVYQAPNTVHVFDYMPGSGTDCIRMRIQAEIFFNNL